MPNGFELWSPECITVGFIAKRCGVSNTTVLRWIEKGELLAFRLPAGHYRIGRKDFADFLTSCGMLVPDRTSENKSGRRHIQQDKKHGLGGG